MKRLLFASAFILFAGFALGQTLEKGSVLALHHHQVNLAEGVTMDQYNDFLADKILPVMQKAFHAKQPAMILQGIGENNKHEYAMLIYWGSLENFHTYWNDGGTPTEKGAEAMAKVQPLLDELKQGDNTGAEMRSYLNQKH